MDENLTNKIIAVAEKHQEIKLAYVFGSTARGNSGRLSDIDIAVYCDGLIRREMSELKLELVTEFSDALKTDRIDLVVLNLIEQPELKYQVITEGKLIYEQEPYRVLVEPRILNEYFDFHTILQRHGLTRA